MGTLQFLVNGLAAGSVYGLVALGFVLIYKATEQVNFAQGELMMLGAFMGVTFAQLGFGYVASALLAALAMGVFGFLLDALVLRRIIGQPAIAAVLLTIGLAFVFRAAATMIWGTAPLPLPSPFDGMTLRVGGLNVPGVMLAIVVSTLVLCGLLYAFFAATRLGLAMQAVSQNQMASYHAGIPVKTVCSLVWGMSAAVSAIAGVLLAPITLVDSNLGLVAIQAFTAAVIGGFGSIPGALLGGLFIGVVEQFAALNLGPGWKEAAAPAVLLLTLIVRPQGFLAQGGRRKV